MFVVADRWLVYSALNLVLISHTGVSTNKGVNQRSKDATQTHQ